MSGGIGSVRRDVGDDRIGPGDIPSQRTAADAYRVSDDQLHRARMVVARNSADQEDLRQLLDMLGLISANPEQPPPVTPLSSGNGHTYPRLRAPGVSCPMLGPAPNGRSGPGADGHVGPSPHRLAA